MWPGYALVVLVLQSPSPEARPAARAHTIIGPMIRVDTKRRVLTLGVSVPDAREVDVQLGDGTRLISHGRTITLADLKLGEKAVVICNDDDRGLHHAQVVKAGTASHAAPEPKTSPAPRP
jgi:hypothetical protein